MIPMRLRLKNFEPIGSGLLDNDAMPPTALLAPDGVVIAQCKGRDGSVALPSQGRCDGMLTTPK